MPQQGSHRGQHHDQQQHRHVALALLSGSLSRFVASLLVASLFGDRRSAPAVRWTRRRAVAPQARIVRMQVVGQIKLACSRQIRYLDAVPSMG